MSNFSHSRIETFKQCKLRYKFRYIDKVLPPQEESVETFMGKLVHKALEKLYKDLKFEKPVTLEELIEWYNNEWKRKWNDNIVIVNKEYGEENYRKIGERCIKDYYRRYEPFNQSRTLGLEMKVKIPLDSEGKYVLTGYIDRLSYAGNGVYEIHDYKTGNSLPVKEYLQKDKQLALYAIAVKHNYQDAKRVKLVWHFLANDKEYMIEKSDEELEALKKETIRMIEEILSEKDFKPSKSALCEWCEFRSVCPLWSHVSRVENLEPNEYLKDPGVKLANRYAELKIKEEEVKKELEKVKEAIIKFSDKEGCNVIAGSDVQIRIWKDDVPKVPKKDDPLRGEFEKTLREIGKWDEVVAVNDFLVSSIIRKKMWPKEVIDKIRKFIRTERVERIYLNKTGNGSGQ